MQAPDEASLQIWMDALRPYKEGWLTKQGAKVKNWKRRWFVLYKTQLAYFDGPSGSARRERNGYILLKEVLPGSVHPIDETMFGKPNTFQVETRDRTFYLQSDTVDQMDDWLDAILQSIQTRGRLQSVSAALERGDMDGPEDDNDVSRDSSVMAPDVKSQAALDAMARETAEYDEEDAYAAAGGGAAAYGAEDSYQMAPPIANAGAITQEDIAAAAGLQTQFGKAYTAGTGGLTGVGGVGEMLSQHESDLEIQRQQMELDLKAQSHAKEMEVRERELALKQRQLEMELAAIGTFLTCKMTLMHVAFGHEHLFTVPYACFEQREVLQV